MTIVIHRPKFLYKKTSDFHMYSSTKSSQELHLAANEKNISRSQYKVSRGTPRYNLTVNQAYDLCRVPGTVKSGW
jgi:hypothetical protein